MNTEILLLFVGEFFVKATAVLLLAALLVQAWSRASAAQRHFVWLAAIVIVLLLPLTKLISPWWGVALERPVETKRAAVLAPQIEVEEMPLAPVVVSAVEPVRLRSDWRLPSWRSIAVGIWLAGFVGFVGYRFLGLWRLRRLEKRSLSPSDTRLKAMATSVLREMGIVRPVHVLISEECRVPMTWGFQRPILVLPSEAVEWSDSRVAAALRHEAGHIGRWDYPVRWIAHLACSVYWLHPLIWLAARSLRVAQEQATDDLVLRAGTPPEEYATQLFDSARAVAAYGVFARHAVAMATPSTLEHRVLAIVDDQRDRRPLSGFAATVGVLAMLFTLALCTVAQLQGAAPAADTPAAVESISPAQSTQVFIQTRFVELPEQFPELEDYFSVREKIHSREEFQTLTRALNQKPGVQFVIAPNITTASKETKITTVTRDFIFPDQWETPPGGVLTPTAFDKKEVGMAASITTQVQADGSLKLRIKPSVVAFLGFTDLDDRAHPPVETDGSKRKLPIFSERQVETEVTLQSGQTVMLTALKEVGDLKPFEQRAPKQKVVVFVSAEIVPPASKTAALPSAEERADKLIIPRLKFQDAPIGEVMEYLRQQSRDLATAENGSVDIIYAVSGDDQPRLSLDVTNISLLQALRMVVSLSNLSLKEEAGALVLANKALVIKAAVKSPAVDPTGPAEDSNSPAKERAMKIVIPKISFREAPVTKVLDFLSDQGKGQVKIVSPPQVEKEPVLSLDLTNIPLWEALKYAAELGNLDIRVQPEELVLVARSEAKISGARKNPPDPFARTAPQIVEPMVMPKVDFQETPFGDVVSFLNNTARELDPKGLGTIISPQLEPTKIGDLYKQRITLSLVNVPMLELLGYLAELAGLELRTTPNALYFVEPSGANVRQAPTAAPAATAKPLDKPLPIDITADTLQYVANGQKAIADGHVQIRCGTAILTADHATYNVEHRFVQVSGKVEVRQPANEFYPDGLFVTSDRMMVGFRGDGRMTFVGPHTTTIKVPAGILIPGKPGYLKSPFAAEAGEIDVRGVKPGTEVKCPYTGNRFVVPPPDGGGASNNIIPMPTPRAAGLGNITADPSALTKPSPIREPAAQSPVRIRLGGEIQVSTSIIDRKPIARRPGEN